MQDVHPEYRTTVAVVGELTVTGVLPGSGWRPEGAIAISGDVRVLWRDQARALSDALRLVVTRLNTVADERYGAIERVETGRAER